MGNRAVITMDGKDENAVGIYLHWNGGRDSVEAFLAATREYVCPDRLGDSQYVMARLIQVIGQFFGGCTSLGVGTLKQLDCDNYDNGVYVIDSNLNIVDRMHKRGPEQDGYELEEFKECLINKVRYGTEFDEDPIEWLNKLQVQLLDIKDKIQEQAKVKPS